MSTVDFIIRNCNGNQRRIRLFWDDVCSYINNRREELEDKEILLIMSGDICIYSQLGHDPIDWEDVLGFFG